METRARLRRLASRHHRRRLRRGHEGGCRQAASYL